MIDKQTFLSTCKALYKQRMGCLHENKVDMLRMQRLEARLREQLFALSRILPLDEDEPSDISGAFVFLATRFIQSDEALQNEAAELACTWLLDDGPKGQAARDALLLFSTTSTYEVMQRTYIAQVSLRPILIYILTQHGARLPPGLTNQAELQNQDPYLQAQVLYYAANDKKVGIDVFQSYYQPLGEYRENQHCDHGSLVAAIWGGLVRRDAMAYTALQRAIAAENDDFQRLDFLRLAALTGNEDHLPVLCQLLEHAPEIGYHFLALHSRNASVELILEGLDHPRTSEYAEDAWWWVSGQTLPKKPRMALIGQENNNDVSEEEIGYIANVQPAQEWWAKQNKDANCRWLIGKPLTFAAIQKAAMAYTGLVSNDLFDLLALTAGQPIKVGNYTWHDVRLRRLNKVSEMIDPQIQPSVPEQRRA